MENLFRLRRAVVSHRRLDANEVVANRGQLERNIVVCDICLLCRGRSAGGGSSLHRWFLFSSGATNKLHVGSVNFQSMSRLSIAISPLFNAKPAFDINRLTLCQIL